MRWLVVAFAVSATPTLAHHEVVVVTSLMPLLGGLATIAAAALLAFRQKLRKR